MVVLHGFFSPLLISYRNSDLCIYVYGANS